MAGCFKISMSNIQSSSCSLGGVTLNLGGSVLCPLTEFSLLIEPAIILVDRVGKLAG